MGYYDNLRKYGFLFHMDTDEIPGIGLLETILAPGAELQKQREALGMTQQQVADRAGINIRQYQRFESGERSFYSTTFRIGLNICHVLKIDPFYYCTIRSKEKSADTDADYQGKHCKPVQTNGNQKYVLYTIDENGNSKDIIAVEYGESIDAVYDRLADAIREEMSEDLGIDKGEINVSPIEKMEDGKYSISGAPTIFSGQEPPIAGFSVIQM